LNLLSNAIKYNRLRGRVEVARALTPDDRLRIDVRDEGSGIAPDKMDALFQPFERLDAAGSDVEGTGLGLALSLNLVRVMGGELTVDSTVGEGSTFSITLPLARDPLESATQIDHDLSPRGKRLPKSEIHIEDNLSNLRLIEQVLKVHSSAELLAATQGRMGLALARLHRPDLILLDLHLPDIPGSEVLRVLREDRSTRDLPVVMISADATARSAKKLLEVGANAYITKPLDIPRFLDILAENLPVTVT
jgi:CheY-like chemotaxis protein